MPNTKATADPASLLLERDTLEIDEVVETRFMRVQDAVKHQAEGNPKIHQIENLAAVFIRDGFTDLPKWDVNLNNGAGGFVFGNGRLEALAWLEGRHREDPEQYPKPRGIATEQGSGDWVVPIKYGLDARDHAHAEAQLVDHNNLVLGPGFTALDIARMYNVEKYTAILKRVKDNGSGSDGEVTATVSTADLRTLTDLAASRRLQALTLDEEAEAAEEALEGDEEGEDDETVSESSSSEPEGEAVGQYLPFNCLMNKDARDTLYAAIKAAKADYSLVKTEDALEVLARRYLDNRKATAEED